MRGLIIIGATLVCISRSHGDMCRYHEPEEGIGHVAFSKSGEMSFLDLAREASAECEVIHGDGECDLFCFLSRDGVEE